MLVRRIVMRKFKYVFASIALVAVLAICFVGCGAKAGGVPIATPDSLADHNVAPTFSSYYATQYDEIIASTTMSTAEQAAALWAIGSYNEGQADQYVYFENKIGSAIGGTMHYQQLYKRKPAEDGSGAKYHYTLKKVVDGGAFTSAIETTSALRFVTHERGYNGLYRFAKGGDLEFTNDKLFGHDIINMEWKKGSDFGREEGIYKDTPASKNTSALTNILARLKSDTSERAANSNDEDKMKGNINILEDNIITSATIEQKEGYVSVNIVINIDVANNSADSIAMLKKSTGASKITWSEMTISFDMWNGGLFKRYTVSDKWTGTVMMQNGDASPVDNVYYSYSDKDCSFEKELDFLDEFSKTL